MVDVKCKNSHCRYNSCGYCETSSILIVEERLGGFIVYRCSEHMRLVTTRGEIKISLEG